MNAKSTWFWTVIAAGLFAFILFYERPAHQIVPPPERVLPDFHPAEVSSIEILRPDQPELRLERAGALWQVTRPFNYPAEMGTVSNLLGTMAVLAPATTPIRESDLTTNRFNADEEFGFSNPQVTLIFQQSRNLRRVRIGRRTPPGDQVYVQVVGLPAINVVDAELLKLVPAAIDQWREPLLVDTHGQAIDRIAVTNGAKACVLQRDPTNHLWHMLSPFPARADNARIEECLGRLQTLQVSRFLPEESRPELDAIGLQPPELEMALGHGGSTLAVLQFGRSPTNELHQVFARRLGRDVLVTVPLEPLMPWFTGSIQDFRDSHLLSETAPIETVEINGLDRFGFHREGTNAWRIEPGNKPDEAGVAEETLSILRHMRIAQFAKDLVADRALAAYGLAAPSCQYTLKGAPPQAGASNRLVVELNFGSTNEGKVYVRRSDEGSVYAVNLSDFQLLPQAGWQLRPRRLWSFSLQEVTGAVLSQEGRVRRLVRHGDHNWSLAAGSSGVIEDLAIEETVRGLVEVSAAAWVDHGAAGLARYGFTERSQRVTLELKNGRQVTLSFGGQAPSGLTYAAIDLDGEPWVFEFPMLLYRDVAAYLSVPENQP